eukprot:Gb_18750 [translate_table: standard]
MAVQKYAEALDLIQSGASIQLRHGQVAGLVAKVMVSKAKCRWERGLKCSIENVEFPCEVEDPIGEGGNILVKDALPGSLVRLTSVTREGREYFNRFLAWYYSPGGDINRAPLEESVGGGMPLTPEMALSPKVGLAPI